MFNADPVENQLVVAHAEDAIKHITGRFVPKFCLAWTSCSTGHQIPTSLILSSMSLSEMLPKVIAPSYKNSNSRFPRDTKNT